MLSDLPEADFPHKKLLHDGRLAYLQRLMLGRARINVTTLADCFGVHEFY